MKKALAVSRGIVGITGVMQLVLGVLFWAGHARELVPVHIVFGLVFMLGLWALAALAARAGAARPLAAFTAIWGVVVLVLGMTQTRILPGAAHWVVQATHLLTAFVAMGLAARLQMAASRAFGTRSGPASGPRIVEQSSTGRI